MRLQGLIAGLTALWAGASGAPQAEDWPHLRGPNTSGVSAETGLAESWPAQGPPVLWRIEMGQGFSGFAAAGDRLYTQFQTLAGQAVACLDAGTGRRIWTRRYEYPWQPDGRWPGPMATPTVAGGRVYFAGAFGLAGCLDARDGRLLWSRNVAEEFKGTGTEYGYACSPLVEDGKVYLPVGGKGAAVVALRAGDGSVAWRSGDYAASYSPCLPVTAGGRRQIVAFLRNHLAAFDPETGRELWNDPWSEGYDEHSSWPLYEEPYLLAAAAFRKGARAYRLDGAAAEPAWTSPELSNDVCSGVVLDGHVYGFDLHDLQPRGTRPARGAFKCLKLSTGEVCWSTDRTGHATAIAADGKLILFSESGELILARATPERFEELARARVFEGPACWTPPALHRRRLYLRDHAHAACLYLGDPASTPPRALAPQETRSGPPTGGRALYAPSLRLMARWYAWNIGLFVLSALAGWGASRLRGGRLASRAVFWGGAFALGSAGTLLTDPLVFTWPASLFVPFQLLVLAAVRGARWLVRGGMAGFAGLCFGYYHLCRSLFLVMGYGFLAGLVPAFPAAVWAARGMTDEKGPWREAARTLLSFSVYFWASALFIAWKTR